jgi:prophage antirepressor-like protein
MKLHNNVRVIEELGQRWFSAADILRRLGVDVARRGANHYLNSIPPSHIRIVTKADRPDVFKGRRGFPEMNFISEGGVVLLLDRTGKDCQQICDKT